MIPEVSFLYIIPPVAIALFVLLAVRIMRARREPALAVPAYVTEDDQTLTDFTRWAHEARRERYDTRSLSELAAGQVYLEDNEVLTGQIVAASDVPPMPDPITATMPNRRIRQLIDEFDHEWHTIEGRWHAPAVLIDTLAEGDWLRELLAPRALAPA